MRNSCKQQNEKEFLSHRGCCVPGKRKAALQFRYLTLFVSLLCLQNKHFFAFQCLLRVISCYPKHILYGFLFISYVLQVSQSTSNEFQWCMFFFTYTSIISFSEGQPVILHLYYQTVTAALYLSLNTYAKVIRRGYYHIVTPHDHPLP